jgi:hypothetical protein
MLKPRGVFSFSEDFFSVADESRFFFRICFLPENCENRRKMESLFIINSSGDVFLEKHWRSVISKSICDYFLEKMKTANVS